MKFMESASGLLVPDHRLVVGGVFLGKIVRDGEVIEEFEDHNIVVNEGLNYLLNAGIAGQSQISNWYLGLFSGNYTPVATVTAATIAAASTEWTSYNEATRQAFTPVAASAQSITNAASTATFTQNASGTIYGAFLASNSAKSATTGTLLAAAQFGSPKTVSAGDLLVLSYTLGASSS